MTGFNLPVPTERPEIDPAQYLPLLLSAIEGFLQLRELWAAADYVAGMQYMEQLKVYIVTLFTEGGGMAAEVGSIVMWPVVTVPVNWLLCDGSVKSQSAYPELFALIGGNYNTTGEGAGNFRLPDMRRVSPYGAHASGGLGGKIGSETHQVSLAELPAHTHQQTVNNTTPQMRFTAGGAVINTASGATSSSTTPLTTQPTGSGTPMSIIHPIIYINFIICALP